MAEAQTTVPRSLQRVRCALCPTCGATLPLDADARRASCAYCGHDALVERRLRTVEAELVPGTDPALVARPPAPFLPAHALGGAGRTRGQCPSCAAAVDVDGRQDHFDCPYCGARSKVEARLAPEPAQDTDQAALDAEVAAFRPDSLAEREAALRARLAAARLADGPAIADELADVRALALLAARDEAELARIAASFEPWNVLTARREALLARLMERTCRAGPVAQAALVERVVARTAAAAWRHDEARRAYVRGVVRAAGRVLFSPRRSAALLDALGFAQPAAMLKLLLEAAEWALAHGHAEDARAALAAAGAALDFRRGQYHVWRDRVDRAVVGEVLLYRLLYLTPPLLAWALDQLPRWQVPDQARVARFMDDCAAERPELAPLLLDAGIARPKAAQTFAEYAEHLALVDSLESDAGRLFALRCRTFDPEGWDPQEDEGPLPGLLARLLAHCATPALADEAAFELARFMAQLEHRALVSVRRFARERWSELPRHARLVCARFARDLVAPAGDAAEGVAVASLDEPDVPGSALARAVGAQRGAVERDHEATRVERDLDEARRAAQLAQQDAARGLTLGPQDNALYVHASRLHATWLAYRATCDPRFKRVLAAHEQALALLSR